MQSIFDLRVVVLFRQNSQEQSWILAQFIHYLWPLYIIFFTILPCPTRTLTFLFRSVDYQIDRVTINPSKFTASLGRLSPWILTLLIRGRHRYSRWLPDLSHGVLIRVMLLDPRARSESGVDRVFLARHTLCQVDSFDCLVCIKQRALFLRAFCKYMRLFLSVKSETVRGGALDRRIFEITALTISRLAGVESIWSEAEL